MTKDKIEAYFAARETLLKCFGTEWSELIEDYSHCEWAQIYGDDISYLENDNEYCFEGVSLIGESEGYQLFHVENNGNIYYALFHVDKKITDEDELDKKFDW